jgi:hypothetical protein
MAGVEVTIKRTSSGSRTTAEHRGTIWDSISKAAVYAKETCPEELCGANLNVGELSKHKAHRATYLCVINNPECQRVCLQFGTLALEDLGKKDFEVEVQETL